MTRSLPLARLAAAGALASLSLPLPAFATTGPWVETPEARVRLVSGWPAAPPAGAANPLDLGVEFALAPGWHVYWKNSGDAGYAPQLDLAATPAIAGAELLFPAPERFDLPGGLVSFGYAGEVIYPVRGAVRRETGGPLVIRGRLEYLVCATECVPYTAELSLDLPESSAAPGSAGSVASAEDARRLEKWRRRLPVRPESQPDAPAVSLHVERGNGSLSTLELTASGGSFRAVAPDLFFESHELFALGAPELTIGPAGLVFRVPFRPLDETRPAPTATEFAWTLTGLEGSAGVYSLTGRERVDLPSPSALYRFPWLAALAALLAASIAGFALRFRQRRTAVPTT